MTTGTRASQCADCGQPRRRHVPQAVRCGLDVYQQLLPSHYNRRAGAGVGVPLPRLPEAHRKRLRGPGPLARGAGQRSRASRRPGRTSPTAATASPIISVPNAGRPCIIRSTASSTGWSPSRWARSTTPISSAAFSVWEERKHDWVAIVGDVEHSTSARSCAHARAVSPSTGDSSTASSGTVACSGHPPHASL